MNMDDLGCFPSILGNTQIGYQWDLKKTNGILLDSGIILDMNKTEIQ